MAVDFVLFDGESALGPKMSENEDFVVADEDSFDGEALFLCVADGAGSKGTTFRPGAIVANNARANFAWAWKRDADALRRNMRFMTEAFYRCANDALVAFKLGDEEHRGAYASTLTTAFIERDGTMTVGHVGNTRLYLLRDMKLRQLTKDQTHGQTLVDEGKMTEEEYYVSLERMSLRNGLGVVPTDALEVQTARVKLRPNDVVVMTSDGVHYSCNEGTIVDMIANSKTVGEAARKTLDMAESLKNYLDNESVAIAWFLGPEGIAEALGKQEGGGGDDEGEK